MISCTVAAIFFAILFAALAYIVYGIGSVLWQMTFRD